MDKNLKRRDFLKLLGIAPFAPSVLKAKDINVPLPKEPEKLKGQAMDGIWYDEEPTGWSYLYVTEEMSVSTDDCTVTLYGCLPGGNYKKIDNCNIVNNGDGTYNINIPEGVYYENQT